MCQLGKQEKLNVPRSSNIGWAVDPTWPLPHALQARYQISAALCGTHPVSTWRQRRRARHQQHLVALAPVDLGQGGAQELERVGIVGQCVGGHAGPVGNGLAALHWSRHLDMLDLDARSGAAAGQGQRGQHHQRCASWLDPPLEPIAAQGLQAHAAVAGRGRRDVEGVIDAGAERAVLGRSAAGELAYCCTPITNRASPRTIRER